MGAKTAIRLSAIAVVMVLGGGIANSDALYSQSLGDLACDGGPYSIVPEQLIASAFNIASGGAITNASWYGAFYVGSPGVDFNIEFYSSIAGIPGTQTHDISVIPTAVDTGFQDSCGKEMYLFSVSLPSPFIATSGTDYLFSASRDLGGGKFVWQLSDLLTGALANYYDAGLTNIIAHSQSYASSPDGTSENPESSSTTNLLLSLIALLLSATLLGAMLWAVARRKAHQLWIAMTDAERRLWSVLRGRRLKGYKFRHQHPVGPFIVDFACLERRLVIEANGGQHAVSDDDRHRTAWLERAGWQVICFRNNDILANPKGVQDAVIRALDTLERTPIRSRRAPGGHPRRPHGHAPRA